MLGFLLVDKPEGPTSHTVIARLRRTLGGTRVGHAGTLDPMATGLLVCAVGQATRLLGRLQIHDKTYEGTLRLGIVTDTQDITGVVVDKVDGPTVLPAAVRLAAQAFVGTIQQVPPAYSAVKVGGVPMHRRIRRGMEYSRPDAREVTIAALDVLTISGSDVTFRVECSSGTYVRTLCHDWGQRLDVGGCMAALRRTRSGPFSLEDAQPLDSFDTSEAILQALIPISHGFMALPRHRCTDEEVLDAREGRRLHIAGYEPGTEIRLDLPSGDMFALGTALHEDDRVVVKARPVMTEVLS